MGLLFCHASEFSRRLLDNSDNLFSVSEREHSWCLNNTGLSCTGPFILRYFSVVNTVPHSPKMVELGDVEELRIWRALYSYRWINLCIIQGSTVCILIKTHIFFSFFFLFLNLCIWFLAALGLHCCVRAFSSCGERGLLFVMVRGLLIAVASLVAEHGL